ncbi:hypothetical protein IEQ34_004380 [Dendrobium chrysotoxum]|uniref:K-box domain-containing protein n=1 Tax=Dendrobium chrysotoxum TaxID=161865 RepID=A0AAV7HE58_DENCH|nr:hypothetical protein IEQ34_004380 [Dendrobium chrysotoxum]
MGWVQVKLFTPRSTRVGPEPDPLTRIDAPEKERRSIYLSIKFFQREAQTSLPSLLKEDLCHEYRIYLRIFYALQRSQSHLLDENLDIINLNELHKLGMQLDTGLEHTRSQMEDLCHEYEELKRKHVMGENLDTLSLTELQQLELQLKSAQKHIRSQMWIEVVMTASGGSGGDGRRRSEVAAGRGGWRMQQLWRRWLEEEAGGGGRPAVAANWQSHLMDENLDIINLNELHKLGMQLETSLKHTRSQMNQLLDFHS